MFSLFALRRQLAERTGLYFLVNETYICLFPIPRPCSLSLGKLLIYLLMDFICNPPFLPRGKLSPFSQHPDNHSLHVMLRKPLLLKENWPQSWLTPTPGIPEFCSWCFRLDDSLRFINVGTCALEFNGSTEKMLARSVPGSNTHTHTHWPWAFSNI